MAFTHSFVKCCSTGRNNIYFWYADNAFFLTHEGGDLKKPIEYCPWCGILLDTNLLED